MMSSMDYLLPAPMILIVNSSYQSFWQMQSYITSTSNVHADMGGVLIAKHGHKPFQTLALRNPYT